MLKQKFGFLMKHHSMVLACIDLVAMLVAYLFALIVVNFSLSTNLVVSELFLKMIAFPISALLGMALIGVYRTVWRYAKLKEFAICAVGNLGATAICGIVYMAQNIKISRSCVLFASILSLFAIVFIRMVYIYFYSLYSRAHAKPSDKTLIIGAGYAGIMIADELKRNNESEIVGFIDDDKEKIGRKINGVKVLGDCSQINEIVQNRNINNIVLAIPSISPKDKSRILGVCAETVCNFNILPSIKTMVFKDGQASQQLTSVKIEDLLGRDEINFDNREVSNLISGSVCMVTGGGGSIGSELARQIENYKPQKLIIVDIYENNAYDIQQELIRKYGRSLDLNVEIASVRDYDKMKTLFEKYRPQIVFHAAAHKHVPLMETNPEEAVKNNIVGTYITAKLAAEYKVAKFVLVSTDKAVNPTNIMGATKRFCEMVVEYFAQKRTSTEFVAVRFGNVLGSNGSVIPLFERQIAEGGPVTVTDPEIVRYFMTIPEAVSLILQAATLARGGEIFVLDMGEPVKILDLAKKMITLHGKHVDSEIKIEFTGLRPGEKLYEELLMGEEGLKQTSNHKIYIGKQVTVDEETFLANLNRLKDAAEQNDKQLVEEILHESVPTFIRAEKRAAV